MKWSDKLKVAGRELLHANVGKAVQTLTLKPTAYRGMGVGAGGATWHFLPDGSSVHFAYGGPHSSLKAFAQCSPLASIIGRKALCYANGKDWILNTSGKSKGKESTSEAATRIRTLMARPNPLQSWKQFDRQLYTYAQMVGYSVALMIKPTGFDNSYATRMWVLPPWMVEIELEPWANLLTVTDLRQMVRQVRINYDGYSRPVDLDSVFIFRDSSVSLTSMVLPDSRMATLEAPINNIIGAMESLGVIINKRGPSFVISSGKSDREEGTLPLTPKEKEAVQDEFAAYGLRQSQMRAIITSAPINLQTVGYSVRDLMIHEGIQLDVQMLCDGYGYPYRLLSTNNINSLGGTDVGYFERQAYQNAIIPEADSMASLYSQCFNLAAYGLSWEKDYSHVAALQEDAAKQATARKTLNEALKLEWEAGLITLNEWRIKLGDDPLDGEIGMARATDPKSSDVPLASIIGVGGVQALIQVLTAPGMSEEARRNTVEIVFGVQASDAARMVATAEQVQTMSNGQQSDNQPPAAGSDSGQSEGDQG